METLSFGSMENDLFPSLLVMGYVRIDIEKENHVFKGEILEKSWGEGGEKEITCILLVRKFTIESSGMHIIFGHNIYISVLFYRFETVKVPDN